jgi:hypothetical protein
MRRINSATAFSKAMNELPVGPRGIEEVARLYRFLCSQGDIQNEGELTIPPAIIAALGATARVGCLPHIGNMLT